MRLNGRYQHYSSYSFFCMAVCFSKFFMEQGKDIMELKKEDMRPVTLQVCKRVHTEHRNFKNISKVDY